MAAIDLDAIAHAAAEQVAARILGELPALIRRALDEGAEARITLQAYRGCSARAAAAFERRHPTLTALAVLIGRRRHYLRADLDRYFADEQRVADGRAR